jgi:hypothetical protein
MRIDITIPDEWLPALKVLADRKGVSLSRLLCESAVALLPASERRELPPARKRGRPKKDDAQQTAPASRQSAKGKGKARSQGKGS